MSFCHQLATDYPEFDIDYFVFKLEEVLYAFINCPDNRMRCQQGKLEHYELLRHFIHELEDNLEYQYPGNNCNEFYDTSNTTFPQFEEFLSKYRKYLKTSP